MIILRGDLMRRYLFILILCILGAACSEHDKGPPNGGAPDVDPDQKTGGGEESTGQDLTGPLGAGGENAGGIPNPEPLPDIGIAPNAEGENRPDESGNVAGGQAGVQEMAPVGIVEPENAGEEGAQPAPNEHDEIADVAHPVEIHLAEPAVQVLGVLPAKWAENVPLNTHISITLSGRITEVTFKILEVSSRDVFRIIAGNQPTLTEFVPTEHLRPGKPHVVTVTWQDASHRTGRYTWRFSTPAQAHASDLGNRVPVAPNDGHRRLFPVGTIPTGIAQRSMFDDWTINTVNFFLTQGDPQYTSSNADYDCRAHIPSESDSLEPRQRTEADLADMLRETSSDRLAEVERLLFPEYSFNQTPENTCQWVSLHGGSPIAEQYVSVGRCLVLDSAHVTSVYEHGNVRQRLTVSLGANDRLNIRITQSIIRPEDDPNESEREFYQNCSVLINLEAVRGRHSHEMAVDLMRRHRASSRQLHSYVMPLLTTVGASIDWEILWEEDNHDADGDGEDDRAGGEGIHH